MTISVAARSSYETSLIRYGRSWGIWLLLLIAPVGARLFIPRADGTAIVISVANRLPLMTSAVIGVCLGLVVSTMLLPAAYIYLRANTNRRQAWQIEQVAPASRVPIALGRFCADVSVLLGALLALTFAGCFLAWLILPAGTLNVPELALALWVVAAPSLMVVAGVRILFDALPLLRRGLGDFAFLCVWLTILGAPTVDSTRDVGFLANLADPVGFVRPLIQGSGLDDPGFAIGNSAVEPGRVPIDAMSGILSSGYLPSRAAWAAIAFLLAAVAGLVYRPRRARRPSALGARLRQFMPRRPLNAAGAGAPPAPSAALPWSGLFLAEMRLIASGRLMPVLACSAAAIGAVGDWQGAGFPLALLWLVFALSEHAGRSEARGLRQLDETLPTAAWARRLAFIAAGVGSSILLALPHAVLSSDATALSLAAALGAAAACGASMLAAATKSAFAPRMALLIAWYVYVAG